MKGKDLAVLLNISEAMVSKLKTRGMPTDTLERAVRWRMRHLERGRMKGVRVDTIADPAPEMVKTPAMATPPAENGRAGEATAHARARAYAETPPRSVALVHAYSAAAVGDFDTYANALRTAMRAVPAAWRSHVLIEPAVFERLVPTDFWAAVCLDQIAGEDPDGDLGDEFVPELYELACGERAFRPE